MLRAVANPAAGGQPGSFTTLTVTGNATIDGNLLVGQSTNPNGARVAVTASGTLPAAIFNTGTNQNIWLRPASQTLGSLTGPAFSGINDAASALTDLTLQGANVNVVIENTLRGQWSSTGAAVTGTISATGAITAAGITLTGNGFRIATSRTPASASASGLTGEIGWDADYIYVCIASDTWKRVPIATWP